MMWTVAFGLASYGLYRYLFGSEEAETRSTSDQPSYSSHSEREFEAERVRLLARYNIIPDGDGYISGTTPPAAAQTTSTEPYKSTKTVEKPKVSVSPASTLKPVSSSPKPPPYNTLTGHERYPTSVSAYSSSSSLGSQSSTQTTSTKPNKSSETFQKPNVLLSPSTSLQPESSSPKHPRCSSKSTLSPAPFNPTMDQNKSNYVRFDMGTANLTYEVPEDVETLIKKEILPRALKMPLSPSTYKDFFHAMLYAEDWYIEKWKDFEMEDVTLELEDAAIYRRKGPKGKDKKKLNKTDLEEEDDKVFVAFDMDSVPLNRPFLISRDFASVRPSGSGREPFQGIIYRVVRGNRVLVEFGEDFHSRHSPGCKYSVKFSFNRVCLKRAHQAIDSVSHGLFKNFLFPTSDSSSFANMSPSQPRSMDGMYRQQQVAVSQICSRHAPTPYLVEGPLCITYGQELSMTGIVIREAVLRTFRTKPDAHILICAPTNVLCDVLVRSLRTEIPESAMFRANAAFREQEEVLDDILSSCRISGDCFSCPSLKELLNFKVVSSTYMSCFRLHNEGLRAGHFSQMFMLDASSTTEPEALVALANFAHESTDVVVTGQLGNSTRWVRSPIARTYGLKKSYFERLSESELYKYSDPKFVCKL